MLFWEKCDLQRILQSVCMAQKTGARKEASVSFQLRGAFGAKQHFANRFPDNDSTRVIGVRAEHLKFWIRSLNEHNGSIFVYMALNNKWVFRCRFSTCTYI